MGNIIETSWIVSEKQGTSTNNRDGQEFYIKDVVRMEAGPGSSHKRSKQNNIIETAISSRL